MGLGDESDFFYDGGEDVFTSKDLIQKNMDGVIDFIQDHSYVDFFLLQEVDSMSWRSNKLKFFFFLNRKFLAVQLRFKLCLFICSHSYF